MEEYENVFIDSQSQLRLSMVWFQQSCRELVRDLPDKLIRKLMEFQEGWGDKELREKLHQRLGDNFKIYRVSVRRLNKKIQLLRRKLKLPEDQMVGYPTQRLLSIAEYNTQAPFRAGDAIDFSNSWSRICGGFSSERYMQHVSQICADIEQLYDLTKGAIDLEDVDYERSSLATSSYWLGIRSHTHRLFKAIRSIWSQSCSSHTHLAKLRLDIHNGDESDREIPEFNLSFLSGGNITSIRPSPLEWKDVTVLSFQTPSLM